MPQSAAAHAIPHTNTMIVDVGSEYTRVGYAGDFHPHYVVETRSLGRDIVAGSLITDQARLLAIVEAHVLRDRPDSLILIVHTAETHETVEQLKKQIVDRNFIDAFIILRSAVCEAYGSGKTTASVLSCSAGSATVAIVAGGAVAEYCRETVPVPCPLEYLPAPASGRSHWLAREIEERVFPCSGPTDVSGIVGYEQSVTVPYDMEQYYVLLDRLMGLREKHGLKKGSARGAVILCGGLFKYGAFLRQCREYLASKYGNAVGELTVGEDALDACFTGASVFGMNAESIQLFYSGRRQHAGASGTGESEEWE